MDQFSDLGGQTAQFVAGHVQCAQVDEQADLGGQSQQLVVVQIHLGEVLELPQAGAQVPDVAGYLDAMPLRYSAGCELLRRQIDCLSPRIAVLVFVFVPGHFVDVSCKHRRRQRQRLACCI